MTSKNIRVRAMLRRSVRDLQVILANVEGTCHRDLATEIGALIFNMQARISEVGMLAELKADYDELVETEERS